MAAIGIIIVTYNSGAEIGGCLDAAMRTGVRSCGGNASADARSPEVRIAVCG